MPITEEVPETYLCDEYQPGVPGTGYPGSPGRGQAPGSPAISDYDLSSESTPPVQSDRVCVA